MSECLVVGGGFLGGAVARALADEGHEVVVYSRSFVPVLEKDGMTVPSIRTVTGTIADSSLLAELIESCDAVFYFAGGSTPAAADADAAGSLDLSVIPATTVLELMRSTPTRRIVLASSGGTVYGEPSRFPTPESHPTMPIAIHGHNALTVERYAQLFAQDHGLDPVILRIATGYGPGQRTRRGQGVVSAWMQAALNGSPVHAYGSLQTRRDFVYVTDVAVAAMRTAFDADPGIYNVGSGRSHSLEQLLNLLSELAGGELEVIHHESRGVDVSRTELDCSRLEAEIGWAPATDLSDGLRATWEWSAGSNPQASP